MFNSIKFTDSKELVDTLISLYPSLNRREQLDARFVINQYNHFYNDTSSPLASKEYKDSLFYTYKEEKPKNDIILSSKPLLKYFYANPHHFYAFQNKKFSIHIDPIVNIHFGQDISDDKNIIQNTRGARVSGYIDQKVYFYTQILENQAFFPQYIDNYITEYDAIPGNGLFKDFNSTVLSNAGGWDYLNANGYLGIPISKSVSLDFGHGTHFIGNGMRSLLLSDFSNNYFYLKLNTKVWKFHYQNIFAELAALSHRDLDSDVLIPKKYMASHYLSFKLFPQFEIGLFESVIFSRENHFEFQYLNPVIFYRSIEQAIGSPDNAMLGINASLNLFKTAKLYGQVAVDEFNLSELNTGWFGNKFGFQLGGNYYNAFNIQGLDITLETNAVRPFTYAQSRSIATKPEYTITSYSHNNQALAHPLGANFREYLIRLNYRINQKITTELTLINYTKGKDTDATNYGGNILKNTSTAVAVNEYGYNIGGGVEDKVNYLNWQVAYQLVPNLSIDITTNYRSSTLGASLGEKNLISGSLGVRYNISPNKFEF